MTLIPPPFPADGADAADGTLAHCGPFLADWARMKNMDIGPLACVQQPSPPSAHLDDCNSLPLHLSSDHFWCIFLSHDN